MLSHYSKCGLAAVLLAAAACSSEVKQDVDSAAGMAETFARANTAVLDIDIGQHVEADKSIEHETDTFTPSDTVYASVQTTGTAEKGTVQSRWQFPDGSIVTQQADSAAQAGRVLFFLTKPEGLPKGSYKFAVLVSGDEVRSKEFKVQ